MFSFVASLGGSISAEHGIGALKARWLPLPGSAAELDLFARIRRALDPAGILNPQRAAALTCAVPARAGPGTGRARQRCPAWVAIVCVSGPVPG